MSRTTGGLWGSSGTMGTQGPGRKRIPNREKLTGEDDALNQIAREVRMFINRPAGVDLIDQGEKLTSEKRFCESQLVPAV